jgi:TonB family protein
MRRGLLFALLVTLGLHAEVSAAESTPLSGPPLTGLIEYRLPQFPVGLRGVMAGDGQAVVAFTVDADGKVIDSVALEATQAAFAEVAVAAVKQWRFEAGAVGHSWPRREVSEFAFRRNGVVTTLQHVEAAREGFNSTTAHSEIRTVKLPELDTPPKRLAGPMPAVATDQLALQGITPLIINFVRVPVVTALDVTLAQTVLEAVKQWRYAPPTQNGTPVLVEVTRSLVLPGAAAGSR